MKRINFTQKAASTALASLEGYGLQSFSNAINTKKSKFFIQTMHIAISMLLVQKIV